MSNAEIAKRLGYKVRWERNNRLFSDGRYMTIYSPDGKYVVEQIFHHTATEEEVLDWAAECGYLPNWCNALAQVKSLIKQIPELLGEFYAEP